MEPHESTGNSWRSYRDRQKWQCVILSPLKKVLLLTFNRDMFCLRFPFTSSCCLLGLLLIWPSLFPFSSRQSETFPIPVTTTDRARGLPSSMVLSPRVRAATQARKSNRPEIIPCQLFACCLQTREVSRQASTPTEHFLHSAPFGHVRFCRLREIKGHRFWRFPYFGAQPFVQWGLLWFFSAGLRLRRDE